jgi:uncharacterized membrane protein YsdA (DUF1294 family)
MKTAIGILLVLSLVTWLMYGIDKHRAKKGKYRIPESMLLGFSFFGGALGGLFGMLLFHHKTRHTFFWLCNFAGLAWQILFLYLGYKNGILL